MVGANGGFRGPVSAHLGNSLVLGNSSFYGDSRVGAFSVGGESVTQSSWELGWPRQPLTQRLLSFCTGGVRIECPSTPTASTPALTLATNCRHLSPAIWLRALTGEWVGGWDAVEQTREGERSRQNCGLSFCIPFEGYRLNPSLLRPGVYFSHLQGVVTGRNSV